MGTDRTIYQLSSELVARWEGPTATRARRPLPTCELRVFSQNGEDGVIAEIFSRVGTQSRWFVEFGVESGRECNCVFLADVLGWDGLFIEVDAVHYGSLALRYSVNERIRTIHSEVTPENIESLLRRGEAPTEFDLLSIDIDGADFWVWEAITAYQPRVVIIEYNAALGLQSRRVQPTDLRGGWNGTDRFGASLPALEALAATKGYRLVHTEMAGCNAFFVRADLLADRFPADRDVIRIGMPNYFMQGGRHPHDPEVERFIDPFPDLS